MDIAKLFTFFVLVALAAIGVLEWLKVLLVGAKVPAWLWPTISVLICVGAGIAAVFGGLFSEFFTSAATPGFKALGGLVVGLVALAFVETCYQQIYKLLAAAVAWLVAKLSPPAP